MVYFIISFGTKYADHSVLSKAYKVRCNKNPFPFRDCLNMLLARQMYCAFCPANVLMKV
jgi:hypothetical protein